MIALIQRVTQGRVTIDGVNVGAIGPGLVALVCAERSDGEGEAAALLRKLLGYRVFADADGKMNLSVRDVAGGLLIVPHFTLAADTMSGTRPSFTPAALPERGRSEIRHFDCEEFDRQSSGIIRLDSQTLASFALVSADYLNINVRFGYHFEVIDTLCRPSPRENYISFRFGGGGAGLEGRLLRTAFLGRVLEAQGFETNVQGDTIDATFHKGSPAELEAKLEVLGFLLGFTRLLDMRLRSMETVDALVTEFLEKPNPAPEEKGKRCLIIP